VVSKATRRFNISIEPGAEVLMAAPSHASCHGAKSLESFAKLGSRLTRPEAAARTAAHLSWISIAGVLAGCGEVAERSKAAVC
jgi:hypothetical protein